MMDERQEEFAHLLTEIVVRSFVAAGRTDPPVGQIRRAAEESALAFGDLLEAGLQPMVTVDVENDGLVLRIVPGDKSEVDGPPDMGGSDG